MRIGRNKFYMRNFCGGTGHSDSEVRACHRRQAGGLRAVAYPVVVKPAIGCSSTLVQRIDSHADLVRRFPEILKTALCVYQKELLLQQTLAEFGEFPFVVEEMAGGSVQFETALPYPVGEISVESIVFDGRTTILAIE